MNKEGLKVLKLVAENFKNITYKEVDFGGKSAIIAGPNGSGKSSFLQAICSPVDSKYIPQEPVTQGEDKGSVEIEIGGAIDGEAMNYTLGLYFSPEHAKGRVVITGADGEKVKGGKKLIETIVGNLGFDIMEFLRLGQTSSGQISVPGVREQIEVLKGLMPHEGVVKLHEIETGIKEAYDKRTDVNRTVKIMESNLSGSEFTQEEIKMYSKRKDTTEVESKLGDIGKAIEVYTQAMQVKAISEDNVKNLTASIDDLKEKIKAMSIGLDEAKLKSFQVNDWLSKNNKPSAESLNEEMNTLRSHNDKCDDIAKLDDARVQVDIEKSKSEELTTDINALQEEKKITFKTYPLPVEGLEFTEEQILYNGLPFNADQHPTSTLIGIGVKIAMAMNPNLRLLIIRDGSLLGEKVLQYILSECDKNGYQVLIEMVNKDDSADMEVNFVESNI